jgi:hypothetical protein
VCTVLNNAAPQQFRVARANLNKKYATRSVLKCERRESASASKINVRALANLIFARKINKYSQEDLNKIIHHQRSFVTAENFK